MSFRDNFQTFTVAFIDWYMEISAYSYSDMSLAFVPIFQMTQITDKMKKNINVALMLFSLFRGGSSDNLDSYVQLHRDKTTF